MRLVLSRKGFDASSGGCASPILPDGRLLGGLFASGRILHATKEQATTAPIACLRLEGTEQVVYRLRAGRAERLTVQTGIVDEAAAPVVNLVPSKFLPKFDTVEKAREELRQLVSFGDMDIDLVRREAQ